MNVSSGSVVAVAVTVAPDGSTVRLPLYAGDDVQRVLMTAQSVGTVHPDVREVELITVMIYPPV